jgi:hypothetical protein
LNEFFGNHHFRKRPRRAAVPLKIISRDLKTLDIIFKVRDAKVYFVPSIKVELVRVCLSRFEYVRAARR